MPKSVKRSPKKSVKKSGKKLSAYNKFVKKEMKTFSPSVKVTKRMKEIAKRWHATKK